MKKIYVFGVLILLFNTCFSQDKISDWKAKNATKEIYAFVGEKIEIKNYTPPEPKDTYKMTPEGDSVKIKYIKFDNGYKAKYKVLKNIHNKVKTDTIEFIAFDHYGKPAFSNYKHVLLFLVKEEGVFYHCKYEYFDVYKTIDDKWAGVFSRTKYRDTRIKPIKLDYKQPVSIPLNDYLKEHRYFLFPKKYYNHEENSVIPHYGNYVEDLFTIKKEGVLKSRGYFN